MTGGTVHRTTVMTTIAVAVLLLGGCSSSTDGAARPSTATTAPSATTAPTTASTSAPVPEDLNGLALGAGDFPAPYEFVDLPPQAREQAARSASTDLDPASVDPPECANGNPASPNVDLAKAGLAVATDRAAGASIVETVTPVEQPLSATADFVTRCARYSIAPPGSDGQRTEATLTELDAPAVPGADTIAIRVSTTVSTGGNTVSASIDTFLAQLDGVQVGVFGTTQTGEALDPAVLAQVLSAGVEKVRNGR